MYHKGYVEALPVQLPEVTELVREYFKTHYNHNYICRHKKKLVENFIEDFIPWLNSGHLKFKGLNLTLETIEGLLKHNGPIDNLEKVKSLIGLKKLKP